MRLAGYQQLLVDYLATEAGAEDLELMALIDQQYLVYGQKDDCLAEITDTRCRKRVRRLAA